MKILFLIGATSRIRNFRDAIVDLADRGHEVRLTGRLRKGTFDVPRVVEHPRISGRSNPTQRSDDWRDFVDLLRGARDYVRYFDPRYAGATRLVRRAYEIAPTEFVLFCEQNPWVKRHWRWVSRALALCESLIPVDPGFEAFLREERPDLILVTPLVTFESYQTDYLKAAHRLGIPVVFLPFSWDNLTNKGLIRVQPDRVLVWNDVQQREAVQLHGCRPADVVVTGAARFDDFFLATPSTSREAFCVPFGLDPARPIVLYLGSSQLTGPNEMELIRRWAEALRAADDPVLRRCNILIRPHPALRASWESVDMSDLGGIHVSLEASRSADQELYDSLHHAHAAVGLNTSAMLEAAIVGRPVHTLVIPGFDEGQLGTMHFHYLVEAYGGLATVAHGLEEHLAQLAGVLRGDPVQLPRSRGFAQQFLRPHGIDAPVSPILADEIVRAGTIRKRPQQTDAVWKKPLRRLLLRWLERRRVQRRTAVDSTVIASSMSLRPVRTALEEIQQGTTPVFVGPWNDTAANELLYWIPFLRWAVQAYGLPAERLIVVSRSAVGEWYGAIGQRYLDATTLLSPAELEHWVKRTVPQSEQDHKQAVMSPFDADIIERAARAFDLSDYQVLHPALMFRVVSRMHKDRTLPVLQQVLRHERLRHTRRTIPGLPEAFVAVGTGPVRRLPASPESGAFLSALLAQLVEEHDVVMLDEPGPDVVVPDSPRLHRLTTTLARGESLAAAQTAALLQAHAFAGGHGDLAVLAACCGVPVFSYHSERLPPDELDRLQAAVADGGWGPVTIERARKFKGLRLPAAAPA